MVTPLDTTLVSAALTLIETLGTNATFFIPGNQTYDAANQEVVEDLPSETIRKISPPEYLNRVIDGRVITIVRFFLAASGLTFTPKEKMVVQHNGKKFTLENIKVLWSGDQIAAYELQSKP